MLTLSKSELKLRMWNGLLFQQVGSKVLVKDKAFDTFALRPAGHKSLSKKGGYQISPRKEN